MPNWTQEIESRLANLKLTPGREAARRGQHLGVAKHRTNASADAWLGVLAYSVQKRWREYGVRMAFGARPRPSSPSLRAARRACSFRGFSSAA